VASATNSLYQHWNALLVVLEGGWKFLPLQQAAFADSSTYCPAPGKCIWHLTGMNGMSYYVLSSPLPLKYRWRFPQAPASESSKFESRR
jgi:hypothetical protein